jgi:hypothetical protein
MLILPFYILFFIGILLVLLSIALSIFLHFKIRIIKKIEAKTAKRIKNNQYTNFELNVIKECCTDELFPYYILYCSNENIWKDLQKNLNPDEKVFEISVTDLSFSFNTNKIYIPFTLKKYKLVITFYTTSNRILIYKLSLFHYYTAKAIRLYTFNINDFDDLDYIIRTDISHIYKYGIPVDLNLLSGNKKLTFHRLYGTKAEMLRDIISQTNKQDISNNHNDLITHKHAERLRLHLDKLKQNAKITDDKYKQLYARAEITSAQLNRKLFEEKLFS